MHDRTHDGRPLKLLTMVDEFTRECLCIDVARRLRSEDVLYRLGRLMVEHGMPEYVRSDNGPEFIATALRDWLGRVGAKTLFIEPGSPWENGYVESFNGKLCDELLNGEIFYTLREAQMSSRAGGGSTTRSGRTVPWATARLLPSHAACRGRLRFAPPAPGRFRTA